MIIQNHNNYYLNYNSFLLCKSRNAPSGVAFVQHMNASQSKTHSHKKHLFLQSSNNLLCLGNNNKLKESKKLIRVVFHIHNDCYKKMKTDPLIVSFPSSQFKKARITVGEMINKIIFTVASQLCEGDGNQFAEQFFFNLLDKQQNHLKQQSKQCLYISSQVQQQTMKSMSSIQSPFPCTSYNQYNCKSTAQSSSSSSSQSSKQTCIYCHPILSQKISTNEDMIADISKRIIITSMSFPNCKSEPNISITRQNLNNIIQLQDMQHVSVYLMPMPLCFRDYALSLSSRDHFSSPPSTFSQQFDEKECAQFVLEDDMEYDIDADINQQFYEALPTYHRSCSSQSFAEEELLHDTYRRSDILTQQQNHHQASTLCSSQQEKNYNNSHLSISTSNNQVRLIRNEEDFSQGKARPNSTDVSQILSGTESLSVHDQEHYELIKDINLMPINKQRSLQESKQQLCEFEGMLQKKVKLNQNPIQIMSPNSLNKDLKQNQNNCLYSINQFSQHAVSFKQNSAQNISPLMNFSISDLSYENFIQEIVINKQSQNNKINQLNEQFEQQFNESIVVQKQKTLNKEKEIKPKKDKPFLNLGDEPHRKSKDQCIFSNFNFNQTLNEIPDFLGSDSELMKNALQKFEIQSSTCQIQQLNFNQQTPFTTNEQPVQLQEDIQSPTTTTNPNKQSSLIIKELKDKLKAQIFLEETESHKDIKDKYLNRLNKSKKQLKKEKRTKINQENIDLILKLDEELTNRQKQCSYESQSLSPNFEDQSTHHTNSLRSQNNNHQHFSSNLTKQIKIQRVLRFLDDSLLNQSKSLKNDVKKNKEELEQLCLTLFTFSKANKFSSKQFSKILNEMTRQMNNRYFLSKEAIKKFLFDLERLFPNWINISETNFGQVFQINQLFQFKHIKNFFKSL